MGKKASAVVLVLLLLLTMLAGSARDSGHFDELIDYEASSESDEASSDVNKDGDSIILWYADDALTEYLTAQALSFQAEKGTKVTLKLVSGVDYLENINTASIYAGEADENGNIMETPDVYITTHDNLMRAYLCGLATEVTDAHEVLLLEHFPQTALNAVTYDGKYVAYPLYYETNFFLYNKTYMQSLASERVTDEENGTYEPTDPEVLKRLSTMIPSTIDDIKDFANYYDAPEAVEAVFKWDISDIFYNYFFIGNYVSIGGECGDNNLLFNVYNEQAVEALKVFQEMNNFFSIDAKEVTYDKVLQDFIDGKTVFTVATTDAIRKIEDAKRDGKFDYEYGVAILPDVSRTLKSRGLSVTTVAAVNGYSDKKAQANDFASYISYEKGQEWYRLAGRISSKRKCVYENNEIYNIMNEYEKSVPLPKLVETGDYWVRLEIAFADVYNGADPDETLKNLSDKLSSQNEGADYHIPFQESFGAGFDLN